MLCYLFFRLSDIKLQIMNRPMLRGNHHRLSTHTNNRPVCTHRRHQKTINHQNIVERLVGVGKLSQGSATYIGMRHQFGACYKKNIYIYFLPIVFKIRMLLSEFQFLFDQHDSRGAPPPPPQSQHPTPVVMVSSRTIDLEYCFSFVFPYRSQD